VLKRPKRAVELKLLGNNTVITGRYVADGTESLWYQKKTRIILVGKPNTKFDCASILSGLPSFCNELGVNEIVIVEQEENRNLIKSLGLIRRRLEAENVQVYILDRKRLVENDFDKKIMLNDFHTLPTGGHAGVTRMVRTLRKHFTWSGLTRDVKDYVSKCEACQRYKYQIPAKEPMVVTTTSSEAMNKIFLDLMGPFPRDEREEVTEGYVYILTIQCELSKYLVVAPLPNKEASMVAKSFVENFVLVYGIPACVATDCGTEFLSEVFKKTAETLKIRQIQSTAYHHESIGALENTHKHAAAFLRSQIANFGGSWSTWLPYWCFAYNTTEHTQTGYTPFELVFGRTCLKPNNLTDPIYTPIYNSEDYKLELQHRLKVAWEEARRNLIKNKEKRKGMLDQKMRIQEY
jgi:Integrase zinc binding domain